MGRTGILQGAATGRATRPVWSLARLALVALIPAVAMFSVATPTFAAARTVRVGLYENEPKAFSAESDGEPAGIFVDLLKEIAVQEDWQLVWVPGTWEEGLQGLRKGRIDLMPDVAYSTERDASFDFHTTPVVDSWSYVYAAPGVRVDRISQLIGKRVAVLRDSIQETVLTQMVAGFRYDIEIVPADSLQEAFRMAAEGEVDAAVANHLFGDYFYLQEGLSKTPIVFNAVPLFYAAANGENHDLLQAIDRHLDAWIAEPGSVYYRTLDRYTTKDKPGGIPSWALWTLGIGAALLGITSALVALLRWQVAIKTRYLKTANEALASAEEMLRLATDAAQEGIFDWNPKTGEMTWTPNSFAMFGFEPDEFPINFETWSALLHPDDRERVIAVELERLDTGDHSFQIEYRMKTKAGDWLWVASRGKAVTLDREGNAERVVGTNMDINSRKSAEEEVLRLNAELEARVAERTDRLAVANKDLESFSYSVSHDLRAPLRAISGFSQILARRHRADLNEEGTHYLDNIVQASERMGMLIEDLLTYSRLGRQAVRSEPVSLGDLVALLATDLASRIEETGGSLTIPSDLPTIDGDSTLLTQILTNLLDNALTYRRPHVEPEVSLGWYEEEGDVVLTVADNGIGIPADYQDKVFNVFQRLHSDDEYPGTGIGLANVKKCVDMLSGAVWLESAEGTGTTFFVRLPKERP